METVEIRINWLLREEPAATNRPVSDCQMSMLLLAETSYWEQNSHMTESSHHVNFVVTSCTGFF